MTAADLADRFQRGDMNPARLAKLRAACERFKVEFMDVFNALPDPLRRQVVQMIHNELNNNPELGQR